MLPPSLLSSGVQLMFESYPITLPQLQFPEKAIVCCTMITLVGQTFTWHSRGQAETSDTRNLTLIKL